MYSCDIGEEQRKTRKKSVIMLIGSAHPLENQVFVQEAMAAAWKKFGIKATEEDEASEPATPEEPISVSWQLNLALNATSAFWLHAPP